MYIKCIKHPAPFGEITLIRVENSIGCWVELSTLGAGITALCVPDRNGSIRNVALSYDNPADYMNDGPCMGKTPGRYANRIAGGNLTIDGETYRLPVNNGPNHLHGGPEGFQNKLWEYRLLEDGVEFSLISPDGDMGYPGELTAKVTYRWSDENVLKIDFEAQTTAPTVVNLTNHTYWNLRGADKGGALEQVLRINASRYLETDQYLTPTGVLADVSGSPMDFRQEKVVGKDIKVDFAALNYGKGYDNCWVLEGVADGHPVEGVELKDPVSGRCLTVVTDQPGVQVYTGNWLSGSPKNRSGRGYEGYDGVAIEAQGLPDAPNHDAFPSQRLNPGETYRRHIEYRFTAS